MHSVLQPSITFSGAAWPWGIWAMPGVLVGLKSETGVFYV